MHDFTLFSIYNVSPLYLKIYLNEFFIINLKFFDKNEGIFLTGLRIKFKKGIKSQVVIIEPTRRPIGRT